MSTVRLFIITRPGRPDQEMHATFRDVVRWIMDLGTAMGTLAGANLMAGWLNEEPALETVRLTLITADESGVTEHLVDVCPLSMHES